MYKKYRFFQYRYLLESKESNTVCCCPYLMDANVRSDLGIIESSCNCYIETMKYADGVTFSFRINEILLFMFDINIGFIVYKIEHDTVLYTRKEDGTNSNLDSMLMLYYLSCYLSGCGEKVICDRHLPTVYFWYDN